MLRMLLVVAMLSDQQACFDRILELSGYGMRPEERAAFLVRRDGGGLDCAVWPSRNGHKLATWRGPFPRGVVAIAHTHPRRQPKPSVHDEDEARRLGIPIYVVTTSGVLATGSPCGAGALAGGCSGTAPPRAAAPH